MLIIVVRLNNISSLRDLGNRVLKFSINIKSLRDNGFQRASKSRRDKIFIEKETLTTISPVGTKYN